MGVQGGVPVLPAGARQRSERRSVVVMSHAAGRYRARLRRAIAAHLGSRDVARVIYGAIVGLALVVGLEFHPPTAGQAIAAIAGAAVAGGARRPLPPPGGPPAAAPP